MTRDASLYRRSSSSRAAQRTSGGTFTLGVDTSALDAYLDALGDAADEAVRPVAQAMAQVLYDRVLLNVSALGTVTGSLGNSIYQVYSKDHSQEGVHATYHISWNTRKAPHGHLVEYGYIKRWKSYMAKDGKWYTLKGVPVEGGAKQIPGAAFVRRAASAIPAAVEAGKAELIRRIQAVT